MSARRHLCWWLHYQCNMSGVEIARLLGRRKHTRIYQWIRELRREGGPEFVPGIRLTPRMLLQTVRAFRDTSRLPDLAEVYAEGGEALEELLDDCRTAARQLARESCRDG